MNRSNILFFVIIALSLLALVYIIASSNLIQSILLPTPQHKQSQTFLENVIGLDQSKYSITLQPTKKIPNLPTDYNQTHQKYIVKSSSNEFKVTIDYEKDKLERCKLRWLEEPTQLANYSNDPLEIVKDFVKRYKEFTQESYMIEIEQMLNQVTNTDPITIVSDSGEIIMDVICREPYLYFQWSKTVNGITNDYDQVSLILRNNLLAGFSDAWNKHVVNDVEVMISKDEAISIAKELAKNYTYVFGDTVVGDFNVLDDPFRVELSMQIKDENTVSPLWHIRLALAEVYPPTVTEIRVSIWADTREVILINHAGPKLT